MKKSMKRVLAYYAVNYGTLGFGVIIQGLVRLVLKPDFVFPMIQFYSIIFGLILVVYFMDETKKIKIWKKNQKKPMSRYLKDSLGICEIKLELNCSVEEAEKEYWDRYYDSKFDSVFQNKFRFKAITREVNYEELPSEVKRKLEKAA